MFPFLAMRLRTANMSILVSSTSHMYTYSSSAFSQSIDNHVFTVAFVMLWLSLDLMTECNQMYFVTAIN